MTLPIYVIDFETMFSDDYTLKKLSTEAYIRDPRFEALLLGVRDPQGALAWYGQEDIPGFLASVDWSQAAILAHHSQFDGFILSHHYGVKPKVWLDTLSMGRLMLGNHLSVALGSLAAHFGLQGKTVDYQSFKGLRWAELDHATRQALGAGCLHDVELTWDIFNRLCTGFPGEEFRVISMTVEMFTNPILRADAALLGKVWMAEETRKRGLLERLGVDAADLQSAERFAELLRAEGIEPEKKDGKNGEIYAFAKTDDFMRDLLEDADERVSDLAHARLGVKSTIDQTRAEALGFMSTRGAMPVYLRYAGAHTTRWSGGDNVNFQNFRRGSDLRRSIMAPAGCKLVVLDLSQIECIAEGELVATKDRGLVPIQNITVDDFVWDGLEWVSHLGVVCWGEKEVMFYDGLWATPDHQVWTSVETRMEFARAARERQNLRTSCPSGLRYEDEMHGAESPKLSALWSSRDRVAFSIPDGVRGVRAEASSAPGLHRHRDRPEEQRWTLRAGQSPACYTNAKRQQPFNDGVGASAQRQEAGARRLPSSASGMHLWAGSYTPVSPQRPDGRRYSGAVREGQMGFAERPQTRKTKVYDIINAGPRYRFTVSGKLVSNCRILSVLAGQWDLVEKFRNDQDPYIDIASQFYGEPVYKPKKGDPQFDLQTERRNTGKVLILQSGYGASEVSIQAAAKKNGVTLTIERSLEAKDLYRFRNKEIVRYWRDASNMLNLIFSGFTRTWGPMEVKNKRVYLPNGAPLIYDTLDWDAGENQFKYKTRRGWTRIWGSKLVAETTQALARVVASQAMLRMQAVGIRIVWGTHDDIVAVAPDNQAQAVYDFMLAEMKKPPKWLLELPLNAEGFIDERYSK